jgi:Redoxin
VLLAMCLFVAVVTRGEQPQEYVARITRPLGASRALTAFGCQPLTQSDVLDVPVDVRGAKSVCRFTLVGSGLGAEALLVEPKSGPLAVYADVNRDGSLSQPERFSLEKSVDPDLSLQLHLHVRATESLSFPVWLGIRSDRGALKLPLAQRLVQSSRVVVEGQVEVGGKQRRIHITAAVTDNRVDPQNARIGFDADGDGAINESRHSLEVLEIVDERAVFNAGGTYLAVTRIDPIAGQITLKTVAEADYQLIDTTPGNTVPDFVFIDFEGRERRLSEFRGKHVLLDFWGSWCSPCVADIPHLKKPTSASARADSRFWAWMSSMEPPRKMCGTFSVRRT